MESTGPEQMTGRDVAHELKASVEARRELGPEMEDHLLAAFLTRLERQVDARVAEQVAARPAGKPRSARDDRVQVEVIAGSFALSIPLLAIAGYIAQSVGVIAVIVGLIAVNLLYFIDRWIRFNMR